jgi:hypothetical protein
MVQQVSGYVRKKGAKTSKKNFMEKYFSRNIVPTTTSALEREWR